ncbi:MAG: thiolase domain-containing protein [Candidatus Asgardarchaeia archaeon]
MKKVYISGVGMTKIGAHWNQSLRELFAEAAKKALDDSGNLTPEALIVGNMSAGELDNQANLGAYLASYIGLTGVAAFRVENACSSGGAAFHAGYLAVASGIYDIVLVGGVEKLTETPTAITTAALAEAADQEYEAYFGASFTTLNALVMRKYMEHYNVPYEKIANWPLLMHENATNNPYAQLPFKVSKETILKSPVIADPIRLFDCSPTGDGAAAVLLISEDKLNEISMDDRVVVAGVGMATDTLPLGHRESLLTLNASRIAAEKAYKMAKITPKDVNVVELHDAFSILGIISLEDLGFSKQGKGAFDLENGKFSRDGEIAVNSSGGLKARGHPVGATGVYQIAEITLQLKNAAEKMQVDNAEVGLAHNVGGLGSAVSVTILKRER